MSGASVRIEDREARELARQIRAAGGDMRHLMELIGQATLTEVDLGFRAERDPWGKPWAGLTAATLDRRRGSSARILQDTGRLRNSYHFDASSRSVAVGSDVVYAITHQMGAKKGAFGRTARGGAIPWGDIPRRAMLPIDAAGNVDLPRSYESALETVLSSHLDRILAEQP